MTKHVYGCACCSADFGKLFRSNDAANDLREKAATAEGWSCNWGFDLGSLGRREFLKGGAAAASLAAMLPAQARAQSDTTIVFTGGTVLTVDDDFSEVEAIAIRGNRMYVQEGSVRFDAFHWHEALVAHEDLYRDILSVDFCFDVENRCLVGILNGLDIVYVAFPIEGFDIHEITFRMDRLDVPNDLFNQYRLFYGPVLESGSGVV